MSNKVKAFYGKSLIFGIIPILLFIFALGCRRGDEQGEKIRIAVATFFGHQGHKEALDNLRKQNKLNRRNRPNKRKKNESKNI